MATTTGAPSVAATGDVSPLHSPTGSSSGYEAFLKDAKDASSQFDLEKIKEMTPSPPAPRAASGGPRESWRSTIADGAHQARGMAQGMITSYFSPKNQREGPLPSSNDGGAPPELAKASSSSSEDSLRERKSQSTKSSKWASKIGGCHIDTMCGKLDIEFVKKDDGSRAKGLPITEGGELPMIEGPPPRKPWNEEIANRVQEAHVSLSAKTTDFLVSFGLAEKKDQALITDFYKVTPVPTRERGTSEKFQEARDTVVKTAQELYSSGLSVLGLGGAKEKEGVGMKQTLMTDYDPSKPRPNANVASITAAPAAAPAGFIADKEILKVPTVATEPTDEAEKKTESSSWNPLRRIASLFANLRMPPKPECDLPPCNDLAPVPSVDIPKCPSAKEMNTPKLEIPQFSTPKVEIPAFSTPRVELPSFNLMTCSPIEASIEAGEGGAKEGEEGKLIAAERDVSGEEKAAEAKGAEVASAGRPRLDEECKPEAVESRETSVHESKLPW